MSSKVHSAVRFVISEWKQGRSLKETARLFGVDPGNLARAFKKIRGITPKEYIDRKRIEYVVTVVATDKKYGYEIGAQLGFTSDLAFYRWVKRAFGVPFAKRSGNKKQ